MKTSLTETRKEDDYYFNGVFWIIAESKEAILNNRFNIVGNKYLVDYEGREIDYTSKRVKTHQHVWDNNFKSKYNVGYTYYPRGRVNLYKGIIYINLNSFLMNQPNILNEIYKFYQLDAFKFGKDIKIFEVDKEQGPHYDFELE